MSMTKHVRRATMKTRWLIGMAVGFFGVSLGLAGQLYAHGGDTTMIHSCVNNSSGTVKFVGSNDACKTNETPVDWEKAARTTPGTFNVDCDAGQTIQDALDNLIPGDTLLVSGTCNENVVFEEEMGRITLDGQGIATVNGADSTQDTIQVRGRGITITGFIINGGKRGISVTKGGTATIDGNVVQNAAGAQGIIVYKGSFATIVNNTIQNNPNIGIALAQNGSADIGFRSNVEGPNIIQDNGGDGIDVIESSAARIDGNTIAGNGGAGIVVGDNSSARIGFSGVVGSLTAFNTIQNNGRGGINVTNASHAGIEGNIIENNTGSGIAADKSASVEVGVRGFSNSIQNNTGGGILLRRSSGGRIFVAVISNNTGIGVQISQASQADVGNNTINGNSSDGIRVQENSGLNLLTPANSGSNGVFGIRCLTGSYATGSIDGLTGTSGQKSFGTTVTLTENPAVTVNSEGCIDRTTP
jgi:parallel beta-helix repeat protein